MNFFDRLNIRHLRLQFSARKRPSTPAGEPARRIPIRPSAFTLIEMVTVIALISMVAGFTVPALKGLTGGNAVDTGAAELSGLLGLARSEAIAQHTIVRFVVATDWSGQETDADLRRVSLWSWHADTQCFLQLTAWRELPSGLILETSVPAYVTSKLNPPQYAQKDSSTVQGDCVLGTGFSDFQAATNVGTIYTRFIEFLPTGSARIPGGSSRQAIFVATQGFADASQNITYTSQANGRPNNWAQLNVDTLTGRTHVYRP